MPPPSLVSAPLPDLEPAFLDALAAGKGGDPFAPLVVLAPSNLLAVHLRRRLALRCGGVLGATWMTFRDLSERLAGEGRPRLPRGADELLGAEAARRLPAGGAFERIRDRPGLAAALASAARDLRDGGVDFELPLRIAGRTPELGRSLVPLAAIRGAFEPPLARFDDDAAIFRRAAERAELFPQRFGSPILFGYGFYDLTDCQERLLEALGRWIDLRLYLPVAPRSGSPRRGESYETRVVRRLERIGFASKVLGVPAAAGTALDFLRRRLVGFDPGPPPLAPDPSLRIVSAAGGLAEAREVARECAALIDAGFPPSSIAIALHDPESSEEPVAAALARFGIPFRRPAGLPFSRHPASLALLSLFRLARDREGASGAPRLARRGVIRFLSATPLGEGGGLGEGEADRVVPIWERLSAELGIVGGLDSWRRKLAGASEEEAPRLLAVVERLAIDLAAVGNGEFDERVDLLAALIERWIAPGPARDRLLGILESLRPLGSFARELRLPLPSRDDLFRLVEERLLAARLPEPTRFGRGGVELLPLSSLRGLRFRALLLPGLAFGAFPRGTGADPLLPDPLREAIGRDLASRGLSGRLASKGERPEEEELLFRLALEAAEERAILFWPRSDAKARRQFPSRLLFDVARIFGAAKPDDLPFSSRAPLRREAGPADAEDAAELFRPLARRDPPALASFLSRRHAEAGRLLLRSRELARAGGRWTRWDGLADPGEEGGGLTSPGGAPLSPTAIESWCSCPRKFLFAKVLGIAPLRDPVEEPEIAPNDRGVLVHAILERFVEACMRDGWANVAAIEPGSPPFQALAAKLLRIAEREMERAERRVPVGYPLLWDHARNLLRRELLRWLELETAPDRKPWRWWATEAKFPDDAEPADGFRMDFDGRPFRFRGKIDRIDFDSERRRLRVVDYKSGGSKSWKDDDLAGGRRFQMPVYLAAAAARVGRELPPGESIDLDSSEGVYEFVSGRGDWRRVSISGRFLGARLGEVARIATTVRDGVEAGHFPPIPNGKTDTCQPCDFRFVCLATLAEAEARRNADDPISLRWKSLSVDPEAEKKKVEKKEKKGTGTPAPATVGKGRKATAPPPLPEETPAPPPSPASKETAEGSDLAPRRKSAKKGTAE
jgi:RecB family exonuclease